MDKKIDVYECSCFNTMYAAKKMSLTHKGMKSLLPKHNLKPIANNFWKCTQCGHEWLKTW